MIVQTIMNEHEDSQEAVFLDCSNNPLTIQIFYTLPN